jgi:hypothetical protein
MSCSQNQRGRDNAGVSSRAIFLTKGENNTASVTSRISQSRMITPISSNSMDHNRSCRQRRWLAHPPTGPVLNITSSSNSRKDSGWSHGTSGGGLL